jgi:hypothetical protein
MKVRAQITATNLATDGLNSPGATFSILTIAPTAMGNGVVEEHVTTRTEGVMRETLFRAKGATTSGYSTSYHYKAFVQRHNGQSRA